MAKRVRFPSSDLDLSTVVCEVPHREDFSEDEIAELFFSRADYNQSRSAARVLSKEAERYGLSLTLEDTYTEKSLEAQERLNQWTLDGDSRRGLERWAHQQHGEMRQQDQFQAIMAVLRAQDDMLIKKNKIDHDKLRKVAHKATKTARHFARMMGKADSYAMAQALRAEDPLLNDAFCSMTVASEDVTVTTTATTGSIVLEPLPVPDAPVGLVGPDVGHIDDLKDSSHERFRLRRFAFGRNKNRDKVEDAAARVSRIA